MPTRPPELGPSRAASPSRGTAASSSIRERTRPAPIATRSRSRRWARELAFFTLATTVPAAVGVGVTMITRSRRLGLVAGGGLLGVAGLLRWQLLRLFTHEPAFDTELRIGKLEIRRYAPRLEARIRIPTDDFDEALDEGFRRLARYISGDNHARERIAMAAPVTAEGSKLAMTVPVTASHERGVYTIAFVMPPGRTIDSLPVPDDARIQLVKVAPQHVAVRRFHGRYHHERVDAAKEELMVHVIRAGLTPLGEPVFAAFDPPSTAPLLRRCEVWVEIAREASW